MFLVFIFSLRLVFLAWFFTVFAPIYCVLDLMRGWGGILLGLGVWFSMWIPSSSAECFLLGLCGLVAQGLESLILGHQHLKLFIVVFPVFLHV